MTRASNNELHVFLRSRGLFNFNAQDWYFLRSMFVRLSTLQPIERSEMSRVEHGARDCQVNLGCSVTPLKHSNHASPPIRSGHSSINMHSAAGSQIYLRPRSNFSG